MIPLSNNPMDGAMTTSRLLSSEAWRFGPDWPGRRCGAKTRRGTPCQKPSLMYLFFYYLIYCTFWLAVALLGRLVGQPDNDDDASFFDVD